MNVTAIDLRHFKDVLPNRLTVVTVEMPHLHTVELAMFVRAGLRFENEKNNGISHFLEHMLFRGNQKYPNSVLLNREFESIGRELRASTLSEYTYFGFSPHISNVDRAVRLFAEFFTGPTFPDIDLEREIILEEYLEELNEKGENVDVDNLACQLLYPGNPLAMSTVGTRQTLQVIDAGMLRQYFDSHYLPGNMVFAAAGPITHDRFMDLATRHFSSFENGGPIISPDHFKDSIVEDQKKEQLLFQYDSDSQIQLQICFRSVSYNDPDYYATSLMSRMFDDGFTSRLQRALREDRGLVYSVECRATCLSDTGTVDFDVSVRPEKLCEVAEILIKEIQGFMETGPDDDELNHFKQRYIYDLDSDQDDLHKQLVRYSLARLFSKVLTVVEEVSIVERITKQDILEIARKIFVREKLNVVVVGPFTDQHRKELEKTVAVF